MLREWRSRVFVGERGFPKLPRVACVSALMLNSVELPVLGGCCLVLPWVANTECHVGRLTVPTNVDL